MRLHEGIKVTERGDHQPSRWTVDRNVMGKAIAFASRTTVRQCKNRALSDEMCGGIVFIEVGENRRQDLARVKFLCGPRIFGVHIDHEVRVQSKKRHLALGLASIGVPRVSLDELPNCETIRCFYRRNGNVMTHKPGPII
jgi:hypothetical protein